MKINFNKKISRLYLEKINLKIPKSKRSQGHIEIILSFIIFISALLFIFIFISPFSKIENKSSVVDRIQKSIIENLSSEIGRLSIVAKEGCVDCCYYFTTANYPDTNYVENADRNNKRKYDIYFSSFFSNTINTHYKSDCPADDYRLGVYKNETIIFYENIQAMASELKDNEKYGNIKKSLGIYADFSFSFRPIEGKEIPELSFSRRIPRSVSVNSREFPVRTMDMSGNVKELIFNLRIW